ncbi:MAG: TlpA disulfide reductase family protein [Algoriphagus sp.]
MKKHLFTCFLASLCLIRSTLTAQVADSPGADFLHRSQPQVSTEQGDTHRGGETRYDTLEDPVTAGFFTLKGEIMPSSGNSTELRYELIQRELDAYYQLMEVQKDSVSLQPGDFYSGTAGKQTFLIRIPLQEKFARFNLDDGNIPLLQNIWVQPGDSLIVHWNPKKAQLHLSGPSAPQVRLQRQLKDVAMAESAGRNPVMLISDAELMLDTPGKKAEYEEVLTSYVPAWSRRMEWLETETQRMERAEYLFSAAASHPVFAELNRYKDRLTPDLYHWLKTYWTGVLHKSAIQFVRTCRPSGENWGQLVMQHGLDVPAVMGDHPAGFVPQELAESLYLENSLLESLLPISFFHLSEALPPALREQTDALYLIREYKQLPAADSLLASALESTRTPWIAVHLDALQHSNLQGRPFSDYGFTDQKGDTIYPQEWKGKLVFLDFWLSGCGACLSFAKETFLPIMEEFEDHPDVLFVTVAVDSNRELWEKSVESGRYTTEQSINLYSGGTEHPTLRQNHIRSFPAQVLLDREGRILQSGGFPKSKEKWSELIHLYLSGEAQASNTEASNTISTSQTKPHSYAK